MYYTEYKYIINLKIADTVSQFFILGICYIFV
jgi:hypothetical protein